jgi:hypothetical protein
MSRGFFHVSRAVVRAKRQQTRLHRRVAYLGVSANRHTCRAGNSNATSVRGPETVAVE